MPQGFIFFLFIFHSSIHTIHKRAPSHSWKSHVPHIYEYERDILRVLYNTSSFVIYFLLIVEFGVHSALQPSLISFAALSI